MLIEIIVKDYQLRARMVVALDEHACVELSTIIFQEINKILNKYGGAMDGKLLSPGPKDGATLNSKE